METRTVSELAELFGLTRQAINNRVRQLPANFVEKNDRGTTVVNEAGIHELERVYGRVVLQAPEGELLGVDELPSDILSDWLRDKNAEIKRLSDQLVIKDAQIAAQAQQLLAKDSQLLEKDRQIEQQLQLATKLTEDQEQLLLGFTAEKNRGFWARLFGR